MNRHANALSIQAGAVNPSGIAHTLIEACRECRDEGLGTAQICADPAVRLMVHQLAFLCRTNEVDQSLTLYGELMDQCRKRMQADGEAKGS